MPAKLQPVLASFGELIYDPSAGRHYIRSGLPAKNVTLFLLLADKLLNVIGGEVVELNPEDFISKRMDRSD